eukprot:TRINITY_DN22419_c0_g1_i1.p1 TRINITY_DN22419_c0_g1~~TRINITY_DN22419_c0_g1_i1.p1  ORF type:complete len:587 (+),score=183.28 TRINITY_DN22419_c0_g1_i1:89-1762(+)
MVRIDLLCLGTGKASTHIYHGEPSTGFVVLQDGEPAVLLGAGLGIVRSCMHYCNRIPDVIYISHNHSDHTGELPLLLSVEAGKGRRKRVIAEGEVMRRLLEHRLAEYHESISLSARKLSDLADFIDAQEGQPCPLTDLFSIVPHRAQHSERCFGFVLLCGGQPVLGWGADSGYSPDYYEALAAAPVLVLDARAGGSYDHASFEDVIEYERHASQHGAPRQHPDGLTIYVSCYGTQQEAPTLPQPLRIGQTLVLYEDGRPTQPPAPPPHPQPHSQALARLPLQGADGRAAAAAAPPPGPRAAAPQQYRGAEEHEYAPQPRAAPQPHYSGGYQGPPGQQSLAAYSSSPRQPRPHSAPHGIGGGSSARRSRSGRPQHAADGRSTSQGPTPRRQERSAAIRGLQQQLQMDGGDVSMGRGRSSQGHSVGDEDGSRQYAFTLPGQTDERPHVIERFPAPSPGPKKVHVHSNEDKGGPPRVFLVKEVRTLDQFKLRVGDQLNIKPIKGLYTTDGYMVRSLDELHHGQELVAVKHAGAPFDIHDLPAHVNLHGSAPPRYGGSEYH